MRVALIDPSNYTLPYDRALARGLAAAGHEVHMIGRQPTGGETWAEEGVPFHAPFYRGVHRLERLPRPAYLAAKALGHVDGLLRLRRLLARLRPDVIHAQWFPVPLADRLALPALRALAPVVLTMHDTEPYNGNPPAPLLGIGAADLARRCDRVVVHTALGARRLAGGGVDPNRIAVVPHGLLGGLPPDPPPPDDPPTFLMVGKVKPYKGVDLFLEAVARMPAEVRAGCRFLVAGKPYMDTAPFVEAVARHGLGDLVRLDFRFLEEAEMTAMTARAAVLVLPYREIEASGVLAMSLGHGRAIVASAIGGFAETLRDGATARLVPPENPDALAGALTDLARRPAERARLGAAARALAVSMQDWSAIAERTAALYADARADRGPAQRLAARPAAP